MKLFKPLTRSPSVPPIERTDYVKKEAPVNVNDFVLAGDDTPTRRRRCRHHDRHRRSSFWQPPTSTCIKLMATGATVGTLVDSLHNQVLLEYHVAPIQVPSLLHQDALWLASSWTVPPLLAVAYLVLGGILPRVVQKTISSLKGGMTTTSTTTTTTSNKSKSNNQQQEVLVLLENDETTTISTTAALPAVLRHRALWAVTTTAMIVKLSDILERHGTIFTIPAANEVVTNVVDVQHLMLLFGVALIQWWTLDRTAVALVVAAVTAYGGPLAELPFVAAHVWTYLPEAAHYLPLQGDLPSAQFLRTIMVPFHTPTDLAISFTSAPCYFAVTMDAIALGRWFDAQAVADSPSADEDDIFCTTK